MGVLVARLVLCAALALTVGVTTANAGGGNSGAAHACQKGGWMNLIRSDGTPFTSEDDCVSYAAQGGTLKPKPTCTAGSENFNEDAVGSQPTTFAGGTIDTAYGPAGVNPPGGVFGPGFGFANNNVFSGVTVNSFQLTFTNAVGSLQLNAVSDTDNANNLTLTGYDAANTVVASQTVPLPANSPAISLSISSTSNNIKYFTIATDDPANLGVFFGDIVWTCN
jgi:hypothetical protein